MSKRNLKIVSLIVVLIILSFFVIFLISNKPKSSKYKIEKRKMVLSVYASGFIDSSDSVIIKPEVSGYIEKIFVRENEVVKRGQILSVISHETLMKNLKELDSELSLLTDKLKPDSDYRSELQKNIEIKKAILDNIERTFQRRKSLYEEGLISKEKFEDTKREYEVAKKDYERQINIYNDSIRVLSSQASVLQAKKQALTKEINKYYIKSPINGKILRKFINEGDYVSNTQLNNSLFSIGNESNLETVLLVDEEYIPMISNEMKVLVTIDSYPNEIFTGKIKTIESQSDRSSRTVKIKADVTYSKPVIFNMTVEANIIIKETEGLFIPATSYKDGYVEVIENGKLKKVKIEVAPEKYNGFILVTSGIKEGQEILIK